MFRKLAAAVCAGLALVGLLIFSGRAAASEDMRAEAYYSGDEILSPEKTNG